MAPLHRGDAAITRPCRPGLFADVLRETTAVRQGI